MHNLLIAFIVYLCGVVTFFLDYDYVVDENLCFAMIIG